MFCMHRYSRCLETQSSADRSGALADGFRHVLVSLATTAVETVSVVARGIDALLPAPSFAVHDQHLQQQ